MSPTMDLIESYGIRSDSPAEFDRIPEHGPIIGSNGKKSEPPERKSGSLELDFVKNSTSDPIPRIQL
ncbi:unnamed protein product, partial [Rotaria socialis]